jgi:hypothetical protein
MDHPAEPTRRTGWGRLVLGALGFMTLAPLWAAAVPLAALQLASIRRRTSELAPAGLATGVGLWWLLQPGELPDQFLRAVVLLASVAFLILTVRTGWSFIHRALAGALMGFAVASLLLPVFGSSWPELIWWVEFRQGIAFRSMIGILATLLDTVGSSDVSAIDIRDLERRFADTARLMGRFSPAIVTLQVLAALALAAAVYRRIAVQPIGQVPGRFRDFRFSEHLGWAVVVALMIVVIPRIAALKLVAANALLVAGVLYALRGAAVVAFGLQLLGTGGIVFWLFATLAIVFMLPIVVGGAILLGVLDAGLNLRRRWIDAASR